MIRLHANSNTHVQTHTFTNLEGNTFTMAPTNSHLYTGALCTYIHMHANNQKHTKANLRIHMHTHIRHTYTQSTTAVSFRLVILLNTLSHANANPQRMHPTAADKKIPKS